MENRDLKNKIGGGRSEQARRAVASEVGRAASAAFWRSEAPSESEGGVGV